MGWIRWLADPVFLFVCPLVSYWTYIGVLEWYLPWWAYIVPLVAFFALVICLSAWIGYGTYACTRDGEHGTWRYRNDHPNARVPDVRQCRRCGYTEEW